MLEHLGIATADVLRIESLEETGAEQHTVGIAKYTHLVLQTVEIHTGLATYRSVDHRQQCGRDVDEGDTTLEGGSSETTKVGHHATTEVDEARMARRTATAQCTPHLTERCHILMVVGSADGDTLRFGHAWPSLDDRETGFPCIVVGEHKQFVGLDVGNGLLQVLLQLLCDDDVL